MIEVMPESSGNVLGLRFRGRLTPSDYRDALAPRVESLLTRFKTVKVLILIDESFDGWTLSATWTNTVFDLSHRRDFDKIAMVGAPKWEEWCVRRPAALLMRGELRAYRREHLKEAWAWLQA